MMAKKTHTTKQNQWLRIAVALGLLVLVNVAASYLRGRVDLTAEKRFTVSEPAKKLIAGLQEPVHIKVFLKGNYPAGFRKLAASSESLLQEFREIGGNNIQYELLSPEDETGVPGMSWGDSLTRMGVLPLNLTSQVEAGQQQQYVFPFAMAEQGGRLAPVFIYQGKTPLISHQELNSAEAMLEYNFADAIAKVSKTTRATVGYTTGNGEPTGMNTYDLVEYVLKTDYNLFTININQQPAIPKEFDVLMIVKPTEPFSETALLKLDQYVMQGGKLVVFMDRLHAELDSLQLNNETTAYDRSLNIHDILFRYGARINPDLVMDLQCDFLPFDVNGNGQFEFLPWNYFPVFESPENHAINKNMGFVAGRFVNSVDTIETPGVRKTFLLQGSVNGRSIGGPAIISAKENSIAPEDARFIRKNIPVAVLLEGNFTPLITNSFTPFEISVRI